MVPLESGYESYLVRIYRRDTEKPSRVSGIVEVIEQERSEVFTCTEDLLRVLGIEDVRAEAGNVDKGT